MAIKYPTITNINFKTIEDYVGPTPPRCTWRDYGFKREGGVIKFETNFVACPCIYYHRVGNIWAFSFDVNNVVNYMQSQGVTIDSTYKMAKSINNNVRQHIKKSVLERYKYNVQVIEKWKSVILKEDGTFQVKENDFKPFSLDIYSHLYELKEFLLKYKKYINQLTDDAIFVPSITGGLDTRYLLGLCREKVNELPGYYIKTIKPDGKKDIKKGEAEAQIAAIVAKKFGIKDTIISDLRSDGRVFYTMTGMFNENANTYDNPNDPQYIYKVIQHGWANNNHYSNIMPFTDELYLRFAQNNEFMRILLALLLTPDLIYVPLISGTSLHNYYPRGYSFTQLQQLNDVLSLLRHWEGIYGENYRKNILKE